MGLSWVAPITSLAWLASCVINMYEMREVILSIYSVAGPLKYFIMYSLLYIIYRKYLAGQYRVAVNIWTLESYLLD